MAAADILLFAPPAAAAASADAQAAETEWSVCAWMRRVAVVIVIVIGTVVFNQVRRRRTGVCSYNSIMCMMSMCDPM